MTLHFREQRGAVSLRYRNRAFSSPQPVVSWSRGRETRLQIKPSGSGDENGDRAEITVLMCEQKPYPGYMVFAPAQKLSGIMRT